MCFQFALKLKRDGYKNIYTKPRRKEEPTIEYNFEVKISKKKSKTNRANDFKKSAQQVYQMGMKSPGLFANVNSKNEASKSISPK